MVSLCAVSSPQRVQRPPMVMKDDLAISSSRETSACWLHRKDTDCHLTLCEHPLACVALVQRDAA